MHRGLWWGHLKEGGNLVDLDVDGRQVKIDLQETSWEGVYRAIWLRMGLLWTEL